VDGDLGGDQGGLLHRSSGLPLLEHVLEDTTRVPQSAGDGRRFCDGCDGFRYRFGLGLGFRFPFLVQVVEDAAGIAALLLNWGRNFSGLGFPGGDDLGERLLALGDEAGGAPAHGPEFRTAAVIFHIDDGSPGYGLDRRGKLSASYNFRDSVRNPDGSAKDGGSIEDQGDKEKSRG